MTIATVHHISEPRIGTYRRPRRHGADACGAAPNYALRRVGAALAMVVAFAALVLAFNGLLASVGGGSASAADRSPASSVAITHVAQPGDTMWSIASANRGDVDHGRYVDALIRLNGGAGIQVGQAIQLP